MYEKKDLPKYTRVFMAYHGLSTHTAYVRHSTTVSKSLSGPHPSLPAGISRNIQATTFLVGPLCFYVTSVRVSGLDPGALDPPIPMVRLWPECASDLDVAAGAPLSLEQVNLLSRTLDRLIAHPRVKYGGPLPQEQGHAA